MSDDRNIALRHRFGAINPLRRSDDIPATPGAWVWVIYAGCVVALILRAVL